MYVFLLCGRGDESLWVDCFEELKSKIPSVEFWVVFVDDYEPLTLRNVLTRQLVEAMLGTEPSVAFSCDAEHEQWASSIGIENVTQIFDDLRYR